MPADRRRKYLLTTGTEKPVAADLLDAAGWTRTKGEDWDLWWGLSVRKAESFRKLQGRRFNHLPGVTALGHKDGLHRTLSAAARRRAARGAALDFEFVPPTFLVPEEEAELRALAARSPSTVWIEKPRARARGEGVRVLAGLRQAKRDGSTLVQEYQSRPHLLDGYKYSLRFYVLLTSLLPLAAWIFDDGFVKLASRPFSLEGDARKDRFRHVLVHDTETPVSSRNTTHRAYRERLNAAGVDVARLWRRIHLLAARTVAAGQGPLVAVLRRDQLSQRGCFELFGFDVMIDADLRPQLIEINLTPSLSVHADASSPRAQEESELKTRLVRDLFRLVDLGGELGDEPADDAPAAEVRRRHAALLERRGGFQPLVPGPEPFALLPFLGACGPGDLALALGDAGLSRPLRPERARAFEFDGGLAAL